jgi:fumarate hydratase subunit alpha
MSKLAMLKPSDGLEGVKKFVLDAVDSAGPNPCPHHCGWSGYRGNFDKVALLAKKALLRDLDEKNPIRSTRSWKKSF